MSWRVAGAASALVFYGGLVIWLTWPLTARIDTHLPNTDVACAYDSLYMGWALSYESHALTTRGARLRDANIYQPARRTLFYGDTGFGALPYFMPVFLLTGNPTFALNVLILGSVALTAWTLHLVVLRWTGSHLAGFIAACTLLTTRWVLWEQSPEAPTYAVMQYFPLIVLLAAVPARRFAPALRLWAVVVLQCLSDVVYLAPAVIAPLVLVALGRVTRPATRAAGLHLLGVLALAVATLLPVYAEHLAIRAENPELSYQSVWLPAPPPANLSWTHLASRPLAVPGGALLLILAGAASLLLPGGDPRMPRPRGAWFHAALWAGLGIAMSVPPGSTWGGRPVWWLPQTILVNWLPALGTLRDWPRLGVAAFVGFTLLAGLAFAECARRVAWRRPGPLVPLARLGLALGIAALMYGQYARGVGLSAVLVERPALPRSYPLVEAIGPDSPLVRILREPGGPLVELPVLLPVDLQRYRGPFNLLPWPAYHARAMYRSIFHWRPLLNGYSSYWPRGFPERMVLASRLPDREALAALRRETELEMILVHTAYLGKAKREAWLALDESGGRDDLRLVAREGDDVLFKITGQP